MPHALIFTFLALGQLPDPVSWGKAMQDAGVFAVFAALVAFFLWLIARAFLPWLDRKDERFVAALKAVTDAHERANDKHTKAIEHVTARLEAIHAEVKELRDDFSEKDDE